MENKKVIFVNLSEDLSNTMNLDRIERWNKIVNSISRNYEFVFLPGSGAYTTIKAMEE